MIPNRFHLVFGMASDFGKKPWSFCHHLSLLSIVHVNRPDAITIHFEYEPSGYWWEKSKPYLTLNPITAPREIHGNPLCHVSHRSDVVRLRVLAELGGYYIDADVVCLRPFCSLASCGFWLGWQGSHGLCNAIIGAAPGAPFLSRWLDSYKGFRSLGRDRYWDEHSVRVPRQLAEKYPKEITTFSPTHFFNPLWHDIADIFAPNKKHHLTNSYACHLWETYSWDWLKDLTPETLDRSSELGQIVSRYV